VEGGRRMALKRLASGASPVQRDAAARGPGGVRFHDL
jgi:hypothetical protein